MKKIGNRVFLFVVFGRVFFFDGVWKAIWKYGCEKRNETFSIFFRVKFVCLQYFGVQMAWRRF